MRESGVNIHYGFSLFNIEVGKEGNGMDVLKEVVFSKKADDYEDILVQIEQKKQEILERMQESENNMSKEMYDDGEEGENIRTILEREVKQLEDRLFDELRIEARFFITSGLIDIDKEIFNIIHENGLVYNGRLIVKSNF